MKPALVVCLLCLPACLPAQVTPTSAQPTPAPTELLGQPFYVKAIWPIAGKGSWDFVKVDPAYRQLFIAHGNQVQAVNIETGLVDGVIHGTRNARAIALDDREDFGYISGGSANEVQAFDRRSLKIVARIPTGPNPRALVFEPATGLLFAVCNPSQQDPSKLTVMGISPNSTLPQDRADTIGFEAGSYADRKPDEYYVTTMAGKVLRTRPAKPPDPKAPPPESIITVIDAETWTPLAAIALKGRAGFAEADGQGRVFINMVDQNAIIRLEAQGIRDLLDEKRPITEEELKYGKNRYTAIPDGGGNPLAYQNPDIFQTLVSKALVLDWRGTTQANRPPGGLWHFFSLGKECSEPQSLTIDGPHLRLFVACNDSKLSVVNADTGQVVTKTPTGVGTGVVEFDSARNLIYAANGSGTLTIIRQHVTDSYQVVQNLSTSRRARVLAVDPSTGEVYVVTDSGESGLAVLVVGH